MKINRKPEEIMSEIAAKNLIIFIPEVFRLTQVKFLFNKNPKLKTLIPNIKLSKKIIF